MDEAFIVVSIISGLFGLIGLELLSHNWFKKERFKFEVSNLKKQNELHFKKMAKELGVSTSNRQVNNTANAPSSILDLAKGLSPEQIGGIVSALTGSGGGVLPTNEDEYEEDEHGINNLIEFARKNPELVKGFMSKAMPKLESGESGQDGWL